jgi:hypothetical protein
VVVAADDASEPVANGSVGLEALARASANECGALRIPYACVVQQIYITLRMAPSSDALAVLCVRPVSAHELASPALK